MTAGTTHGARQAALLLHALPSGDREWALAQLADGARAELLSLLDELRELSIPADSTLLDDAIRSTPSVATPTPADDADPVARRIADLDGLDEAGVAVLIDMLRREPPRLVACLLGTHDWCWRDHLLDALGRERRRQVESELDEVSVRPGASLAQAVLLAVTTRLATALPISPAEASLARSQVHRGLAGVIAQWREWMRGRQ